MGKEKINEATLEARIDAVLKNIFPTFKEVNVLHQKYFSINFGKHDVLVDLKEPSTGYTKAILDVLLKIDDTNIILLELKREGLQLDENDVNQGLSYARLTHPMPPIVLISNGNDNWLYNTYNKQKLDKTSIDIEYIQTLIDNSFKLAINDFKDAVNTLLNNDYSLFSKIINEISELKFQRLIGTINEYNKPLCNEFKIERKIIGKIDSLFSDSQPLIGIVGSAFSGKTNLLYQFFEKYKDENCFLLYIDCNDHNYSIFQQLANHFTSNTKVLITKDKIREWLINSFTDLTESKFFLLIDNFNNYIPEEIKNEIIELIDIFKGINHYTLYTIDKYNFKKIAFVENRQYMTIIGEYSKIINLDELDDDEYEESKNVLFNKFRIAIEHGGHYTPEYREPRVLRHLANIYKDNDVIDNQFVKIVAVPDYTHLKAFAGSGVYSKNVRELYKKITFCFISEQPLRKKDSDLQIIASGSGAILMETFKEQFPGDLEELIKSSVVVLKDLHNGNVVIYPKIPELIAYYSIPFISKLVMDENTKGRNYQEICSFFIDIMIPFPYCDISATGVLMEIAYAENGVELFSELVQELLKIPPHFEQINKGTKTLMYLEDIGHIQLNFEDSMIV
ncbi:MULTISPECIES: hypothetical protein [Flavobacterium]|uniref:hypothetical protein n=1 Tax=Flavobacterium TaxID=237 RepID=UPI0031A9FAF3